MHALAAIHPRGLEPGTSDSTFTFKGLTPGQHRVVAVIGYGDHSAMAAARDTVTFVVKP